MSTKGTKNTKENEEQRPLVEKKKNRQDEQDLKPRNSPGITGGSPTENKKKWSPPKAPKKTKEKWEQRQLVEKKK